MDEYSKIDVHINLSKNMYNVDQSGKKLLKELEDKKYVRKLKNGRSVFADDIEIIYNVLVDTLNIKKFKYSYYFCLQYYLDDLLFKEVKQLESFYNEDDNISLTKIYLSQDLWIFDFFIYNWSLSSGCSLNGNDINTFIIFLRDYENMLYSIKCHIKNLDENNFIKKKLDKIINHIHIKHRFIWSIIENFLKNNIEISNPSED